MARTLPPDEGLQPESDKCGLIRLSSQLGRPPDESVIDIESRAHAGILAPIVGRPSNLRCDRVAVQWAPGNSSVKSGVEVATPRPGGRRRRIGSCQIPQVGVGPPQPWLRLTQSEQELLESDDCLGMWL